MTKPAPATPRRQPRVWVVTADGAAARIYRATQRNGALTEIDDLANPAAHAPRGSLRTDRQGHVGNVARGGGHSMQRNASAEHHEHDAFAKRLAQRLARGRRQNQVDRIYLMAEPRLLGVVRGALDRATRRLVAGEVDKDLMRQPVAAVRRLLPARL